jgi:hypothetical protein
MDVFWFHAFISFSVFFFFKRRVRGFELRTLHLLALLLEPGHQPFFVLVIFQIGLLLFPGPTSDCHPPTYASQLAGITSMYHYTWLVFELESC